MIRKCYNSFHCNREVLFFLSNEDYMGKGYKIKKEQRLAPTFVNLKSNTMKNTLQRYGL